MSPLKKFSNFCNENAVILSGIAMVVSIHWVWYKLQQNPYLVPQAEKKELPIFKAARYLKHRLMEEITHLADSKKSETVKDIVPAPKT